MIYIENKNKKIERLKIKYPNAEIIDVTSKSETEFVKFSPFYPIEGIPIPFTTNAFGSSVEGIWQGLKVFEIIGTDKNKFRIKDMINIKRSTRINGKILGHQKGLDSLEVIDYATARTEIFIKCYNWVLINKLDDLISEIAYRAQIKDLVFLDYNTNEDLDDLSKPLSHAALLKQFIYRKVNIYKVPVQGKFEF